LIQASSVRTKGKDPGCFCGVRGYLLISSFGQVRSFLTLRDRVLALCPSSHSQLIHRFRILSSYQLEDSDSCSIPRHHSLSTDDFPALKIIQLCRTFQKG